ncbi:cytochrome c [Rufibacter sp. LB8]|uniref:c-type cytochrome n=1 Tax=Rufibacter sp. LB8 TaxID=2777781 RepID=UPI00178C2970|nr:cytochrome c [Rufibacter sp. LB8]
MKLLFTAFLMTAGVAWLDLQTNDLAASRQRGERVYQANCQSCHLPKGEGVPGTFPPLAPSDFLLKDQTRAINVVVHGLRGPIKVNGKKYDLEMPAQAFLTDQEIADVMNYVQNSWGNKAPLVTPGQVKAARK